MRHSAGLVFITAVIFLVAGCATTPDESYERDEYGYLVPSAKARLRYSDVPVPKNFSLVPAKSLAVENQTTRVSSLIYKGRADKVEVINFYKEHMQGHGWELINLIESSQTVLNYSNGSEVCTIVMTGAGNDIKLNISISPGSD